MGKVGINFIHGDIRNKEDFDALPIVDTVIEASAEPSVLAGLNGGTPDYLINTNLFGTVNCLNYAVRCNAQFVFLSTSRVYPIKTIETLKNAIPIGKHTFLKGRIPQGIINQTIGVLERYKQILQELDVKDYAVIATR